MCPLEILKSKTLLRHSVIQNSSSILIFFLTALEPGSDMRH